MELSPKQQTTELIKKSKRILVLGHKKPDGDMLGSGLALVSAIKELDKSVEFIVSEPIPQIFNFLPNLKDTKDSLNIADGKVLRIDTEKLPVSGLKYQKKDDFLDIILFSDKNLKFEFIEIINGNPKPDLIIVLDTADVEKIDSAYDANTELFFEIPVVNIDHHPGNEYFGTVNLVDLTATSTAEILVSLFEALGIKMNEPDMSTNILCGIISDTQSFRATNTTPKSLTVAAQLLAGGARQQEIISNLYKQRPLGLFKLWGKMLAGIQEDKNHRFAWTKVSLSESTGVSADDVFEAASELLSNTPEADVMLILCEIKEDEVIGRLKGSRGTDVLPYAKLFDGNGTTFDAEFKITGKNFDDAEKYVLKKFFDFWGESAPEPTEKQKQVWDVIEKQAIEAEGSTKPPETAEHNNKNLKPLPSRQTGDTQNLAPVSDEDVDVIDSALKSLVEEHEKDKKAGFSSLGEVIEKKKEGLKPRAESDEDVFEEE